MTHRHLQVGCGPRGVSARSLGSRLARVALACALVVGCGGSRDAQREQAKPRDPGQLAMRDPSQVAPTRTADAPLGTLTPIAQELPAKEPPASGKADDLPKQSAPPPLIQVADDAQGTPFPLRDHDLVLPTGLIIHQVPRGVSARVLRAQESGDEVWEMIDARGRRLALIKARSWQRAASSEADLLTDTRATRGAVRRATWKGKPVQVVTDRFRSETHIYTVDRRTSGTDWIWRGLELTTPP